ncbi:hypothetical protein CFP65_2057 [Kitasatospora sp. MMS16-BH015]|uniref:hypothetical protein n=1 Tax=Kitasatospora sp. MMS16-BH015 TaxID=2018025 RepID=UPI000CA2450F|nr:hypothetical protein [Kitasatospora sp. MMS16-BH015]AUG76916.1 hypothetical protein CFP65_2057 [Kitasatospora sp. MMS16-BH015]
MLSTASRGADARRFARRLGIAGAALAVAAAQLLAGPAADARGPGPYGPIKTRATTIASNPIPFTTRFEENMHGSITRISNSLMTCDETKAPLDPKLPKCEDARTGAGSTILRNNDYPMKYVNIDPGSIGPFGDEIYSASSADLGLIDGSNVKYARLYWGGTRGIGDTVLPETQIDEVYLKLPGEKQYRNIANDQPSIGYITTDDESSYQASADITDLVKQSGNGTYTVANMDSVVKPHSWGGWSIVIAYQNDCKPFRHIHLWDGFQVELPYSKPHEFDLTDLETPKDQAQVQGKLGFVVYDGDLRWYGDTLSIKSTNGPLTPFTDVNHVANDAFNSTIEELTPSDQFARNPYNRNNFGYDSNRWDISPFLRSGDTDIKVMFDTQGDGYDLGVFYAYVNLDDSMDD